MSLLSPARLAVAVIAIGTVLASCTGTATTPARPSPIPNPTGLQARVRTIEPRVRNLVPRLVNVAPRPSSPNSFAVNTDVLFAFDRSDLSLDAQSVLATVVQKLDQDPAGTVSIVGYTDNIGAPDYNSGLSQRRAASVQAYLQAHVDNQGLHYRAQGFGEADPVAPNQLPDGQDNPAGRQQNRRVVIAYTSG